MFTGSHLAQLRALQEAHLTETVLVEQVGEESFNDDTGMFERDRIKVWDGRGKVVFESAVESDSGGRLVSVDQISVRLPVGGTDVVRRGHEVTVVSSDTMPGLAGRVVRLTAEPFGGQLTLRRFKAEER